MDGPAMEREVLRLLESREEIAALQGLRELRMEDIYDLSFLQFRHGAGVDAPGDYHRGCCFRTTRSCRMRTAFVGEHTVKYFELLGEERVASAIDPCFKFQALRQETALSCVLEHIFKPAEARRTLSRRAPDDTLAVLAAPGRPVRWRRWANIRRLLSSGIARTALAWYSATWALMASWWRTSSPATAFRSASGGAARCWQIRSPVSRSRSSSLP